MDIMFSNMLEIGIYSGVMVLVVLILRLVFRKASKAVICALWLLVGFRMLLFIPIESNFAIMPRLSIKDMVREYSEDIEMQHLQEYDGINISETEENASDSENIIAQDNDFKKDSADVPTQNISDDQKDMEIIVGLKDGTIYKYVNSESNNYSDEASNVNAQQATEKKTVIFNILGFIWFGGTIAMFIYGVIKAIIVKRQLADAVRLDGYNDVYLTSYARNAFVFGIIKPRIYLNYSVSGEQRKDVLAHEREHIFRRDYIFKAIAFILLSLYWFMPWVWVAFIMYSRDMELACDEGVIRNMDPESRARYAETLFGCSVSGFDRAYNAVSFGELGVNERVKNIMKYKKKTIWISVAAGIVAVLCLILFMTPKDANAESKISGEEHNESVSVDADEVVSESKQKSGYAFMQYKEYFDEITGKLSLPEGIESIGDNAFAGCTQIKTVELPSSVKVIGKNAFARCTNLEKISLQDGLIEIGDWAFKNCSLLTYIICPGSLEKIGVYAFYNCKSLMKVILPEKMLDSGIGIYDNAFTGCYSLLDEYKGKILNVNSKAYQVDAIEADSDCTNIDYSMKEEAPDKFQMKLDDIYDSFYVVIYSMENGDIICENYYQFPYEEKTDYLGEKEKYKLSDDCKIIVQAKDKRNNGKICYINKDELAYIVNMYGFVKPDGSHESYIKSEYVYPFLCIMDQKGEVRCLRECYDIFEVSKNLYDKIKNTNYTQEQIETLDKRLKEEGITEYDICNATELNMNKAGQTYGPGIFHADLILARGINGSIGYVSEEELCPTVHSTDEALEQTKESGRIIPLYNCEGEVIDGCIVGSVKDEEIEEYLN